MIRLIGACCIVTGCGGFGFAMAAANRREEAELVRLITALEYMSCELSYRMTPLAPLCRGAADEGLVGKFLTELAAELERLELTVAEVFRVWPGDLVRISRSGWVRNGLFRAVQVTAGMDDKGYWSRLELAPPDVTI